MAQLGTIRKSLTAAAGVGVTTLVGTLGASMADGNLTAPEFLVSLGAALAAAAAVGRTVWAIPNDKA